MTAADVGLLAATGFGAGVVNAVAGGGTLLTFPALLAVGLPPVAANATNTLAIWPGTLSSVWAYRAEIAQQRDASWRLMVPASIGGAAGALLVLGMPPSVFEAAVPYLLLFACGLLALQAPLKRWASGRAFSAHPATLVVALLGLALYGGYFGAGLGILTLAVLSILLPRGVQEANALKVLLAMVVNGIAALSFLALGAVHLPEASVMLLTSLAGGWAGARFAQRLSPAWMRGLAITVGLAAAAHSLMK